MKRHILFLGFILMILGLHVDAQTLKNIHRHNLPVLQIPVELIDKVETVDVEGQKYLHVIQFNGFVNEVPVTQIDSITHTDGTALDPSQLGNLRTASVMGVVTGPTGAPEMNAIVRSPYGGEETRTDPNGVFFLNDIIVYDKLGYITITKPGFHQASRSFLPLETGSNRVNVQLLPMTQSGSFNATSGGTVTSGLLQLNFPANAVTLNGQPYTGTVNVYAAALDPSSPEMFDQMPGELLGGMNDSLQLLRSFGMAAVELRDENMNELQLAEGSSATLTFNIPSALQADAPATIDWWSFDEALGYWKHEGEAVKQDTQYVAQASHFSWWNLDFPGGFVEIHGSLITPEGDALTCGKAELSAWIGGPRLVSLNENGQFCRRLPVNETIALHIKLYCESSNLWEEVESFAIQTDTTNIVETFSINTLEFYTIIGTILSCEGLPVESGYVSLNGQIFFSNQSVFSVSTCLLGLNSVQVFDATNPDSLVVSDPIFVDVQPEGLDVGSIITCSNLYSYLTDVDGNQYVTVQIGDQRWMTQNLRVQHFSDGSDLSEITNTIDWIWLNSPAFCTYNNEVSLDSALGNLYNWFTVNDVRNVCPAGWHIPSDEEWTQLTNFLGGELLAGGKLKLNNGWNNPNLGATNESGFSAKSGGYRFGATGAFSFLGSEGFWWTSSEAGQSNAWFRTLSSSSTQVSRSNYSKQTGMSIRCVKD
ncbi:MAG: FISUMP domain-containing protein [Bacteroidia bacterium]